MPCTDQHAVVGFDDFKPVPGVPEAFRDRLLPREVRARVLEARRIEPAGGADIVMSRQTFAVIDAGTGQGLRKGMVVYWDWSQGCCNGQLIEVGTPRSQVMFEHGVLSPTDPKPLVPGDLVSTTRPD